MCWLALGKRVLGFLLSIHTLRQRREANMETCTRQKKAKRVRILGDKMCMRAKSRELVWLLFRQEFEGRLDGEPVCKGSHVSLFLRLL